MYPTCENTNKVIRLESVNSKLNWNDNLAIIFEAKLTFNKPTSLVRFDLLYFSAWLTPIFQGMNRDAMFLF